MDGQPTPTPKCRYCGAPLVASESVRRGYGRACAIEHRQPYGRQVPRRALPRGARLRMRTVPKGYDHVAALHRLLGSDVSNSRFSVKK